MKRLSIFLLAIVMLGFCALSASANTRNSRLADDADLLTESEEAEVLSMLDQVSEERDYDAVIVTTQTLGNQKIEQFAKNYFESGDYGMGENGSGVILVVLFDKKNDEGTYYVEFFGDARLPEGDAMSDYFIDDLANRDFYSAFVSFAQAVNDELKFPLGTNLLISIVVGLIVAFVVTSAMKAKLKSVQFQNNARDYIREGSFNLEHSRDLYLYSTVTRVARPKNNGSSGSRGGSGGSRGGGGRF